MAVRRRGVVECVKKWVVGMDAAREVVTNQENETAPSPRPTKYARKQGRVGYGGEGRGKGERVVTTEAMAYDGGGTRRADMALTPPSSTRARAYPGAVWAVDVHFSVKAVGEQQVVGELEPVRLHRVARAVVVVPHIA